MRHIVNHYTATIEYSTDTTDKESKFDTFLSAVIRGEFHPYKINQKEKIYTIIFDCYDEASTIEDFLFELVQDLHQYFNSAKVVDEKLVYAVEKEADIDIDDIIKTITVVKA